MFRTPSSRRQLRRKKKRKKKKLSADSDEGSGADGMEASVPVDDTSAAVSGVTASSAASDVGAGGGEDITSAGSAPHGNTSLRTPSGDGVAEPVARKKKKRRKKKGQQATMLSFGHADEDGDVDMTPVGSTSKSKKRKTKRKVAAPLLHSFTDDATMTPQPASSRSYTEEMLTALRSVQKTTVRRTPAASSGTAAEAEEAGVAPTTLFDSDDSDRPSASLAQRARDARLRKRQQDAGDFIPLDPSAAVKTPAAMPDIGESNSKEQLEWELNVVRRGAQVIDRVDRSGRVQRVVAVGSGAGEDKAPDVIPLEQLEAKLASTITKLQDAAKTHQRDHDKLHAESAQIGGASGPGAELDTLRSRSSFFRELRSFVSELSDCLTTKNRLITDLQAAIDAVFEARTAASHRRRCVDVLDEMDEAMASSCSLVSMAGVAPAPTLRDGMPRNADTRKVARQTRRRSRPLSLLGSDWGADPETSDSEEQEVKSDLAKLLNEDTVGFIMNDVHSDFRDLKGVTWRFLKWRYCSPTTYADTYCSLSLPKLLAPYVRLDLLNWLPLSRPDQTLDEFPFFTTLFSFHEPESEEMDAAKATVSWRDADATDDARRAAAAADETLIPAIIELVAAPRLAALAGAAWDPLVASQTANLVRAFEHVKEFDLPDSSCEACLAAVLRRLEAVSDDLFVPIVTLPSGGLSPLTLRQFRLCVTLLRSAMAWNNYLAHQALYSFAMQRVLCKLLLPTLSFLFEACMDDTKEGGADARGAAEKAFVACLEGVLGSIPTDWLFHDAASAPLGLLLQRVAASDTQAKAIALRALGDHA